MHPRPKLFSIQYHPDFKLVAIVMAQSKPESGPQSPPPAYTAGIPTEPIPSHLQYDETLLQCDHVAPETDKFGRNKSAQPAYFEEKFNCQYEHDTNEMDELDLLKEKQEIGMEDGKWKWETKRGGMRRKWETAKDDLKSKWATKTSGENAHSYVPLNENEKPSGGRSSPYVTPGPKKVKPERFKRHTRAELSGNHDAALMAGLVSLAIFATVLF